MFLSRMIKAFIVLVGFYSFSASAAPKLLLKTGDINTSLRSVVNQYQSSGDYYIVQFKDVITRNDQIVLKKLGGEVINYIPDNAYLVKMENKNWVRKLKSYENTQAVLGYTADFKVSPDFGVIDQVSGEVQEKILVTLFSEDHLDAVSQEASELGAVQFAKGNSIGLVGPLSAVNKLAQANGVKWIEPYPDFKFQNFEIPGNLVETVSRKTVKDLDGYESGTKIMNFEAAWNRGFTGRGQLVGFSDTGLDTGMMGSIHQDFRGQVEKGYAYGLFSFSWNDPMGHGTHVAGSIAGNGSASSGALRGGAYEAKLIAGGMWSQLLNNMIPPQDITVMFKDAYADGARIHTNSWGSPRNPGAYDQFAETVDKFMWDNPEMLILFAAGNSGTDQNNDGRVDEDSIGSPATAKNVMAVGASENLVSDGGIQRPIGDLKNQQGQPLFSAEPIISDTLSNNENGIAAFSSRGPTDDKRTKPDVVAPGANILSVRSQVDGASELWGALNGDYTWSGGTSMSCPLVAGGAAVARQYLMANGHANPSAALVKGFLMHTATDMYPGQFGNKGKATGQEMLSTRPNPHQGFGRVNMDAATDFNGNIMVGEVTNGGMASMKLGAGMENFKITMIYTDAPAAANSRMALVNNLDVQVYEGGTMIASGTDSINNHEYLEISGATGEIEIRVNGTNVPMTRPSGALPFALIVSPL